MLAEKRVEGQWGPAYPPVKNEYFGKYDGEPEFEYERVFSDRNYNLFAMLADVRNGYGFAGVNTGEGFVPIAEQRGIPNDVAVPDGDYGDHSQSWLTLRELYDYDWAQRTTRRGVCDLATYSKWKVLRDDLNSPPSDFSGGIFGGKIVTITSEDADLLIESTKAEMPEGQRQSWHVTERLKELYPSHWVSVEWQVNYAGAAGRFYTELMPELKRLSDGDLESIRLVFGFDS